MSQENVELVRGIWRVFASGGFPAEAFSEEVEWHTASDLPDSGSGSEPLRGPTAVARMLAEGWENVEEPWLHADEFLDCGERVLVTWRGGGTSRAGRVPVEWHEAHVYEIAAGKVRLVREFRTRAEAVAAVGVSE
jgi:ketosteroid isomerase-like protein